MLSLRSRPPTSGGDGFKAGLPDLEARQTQMHTWFSSSAERGKEGDQKMGNVLNAGSWALGMWMYVSTHRKVKVCSVWFVSFLFWVFFFSFLQPCHFTENTRASNKQQASVIDAYNRTVLVINYSNELVSRVQALNTCLVTVAIAPDHQSARGNPMPVTREHP